VRAMLFSCLAATLTTGVASTQKPPKLATIVGIVADTNKAPLADAEIIAIRSGITTLTDSRGIFILGGLPAGEEVFRIRRIGYRSETFDATLVAGDTIRIGVILAPAAFELPELSVVAEGKVYSGKMTGFADRMLHSGAPRSSFLTRAELAKMRQNKFIDVLAKAGLKRVADRRGRDFLVCSHGSGFGPPVVVYYLDGAKVADPNEVFRIDPETVEAVEVYRSAADRPAQFNMTGSDCTVLIWTR
jgi:carboxypeptidase family protein